jgi:hypothetical protein
MYMERYIASSCPILAEATGILVMENAVELGARMRVGTVVEVEILTVDLYNEVWQRA